MARPKRSPQAKREYKKPAVTKRNKLVSVTAGGDMIISGAKA